MKTILLATVLLTQTCNRPELPKPGSGQPGTTKVPEPSTLVLAGVAAAGLAAAIRGRRK